MSVSGGTMSGRRSSPDPIAAALSLLQDADKFKARLNQLGKAEESLRKITDKYGKIQEIERSRAAAARAKDRAEAALAEAETKAKKLVTEAEESASATRQEIKALRAEFDTFCKKTESALSARDVILRENEDDFGKRATALKRAESNAKKKAEDNLVLKKDLEGKARKLAALCKGILG